ncbi:uncharacterized protein LOC113215554 isoform X2 [Frankliniella occidentalis]|nr:uncharacterized protein LOC113215554 isoform X2 [Frankliniella occidentalis]
MDLLPDDVLAQVMSLLSLPDLFQLRLACKRFASLAFHPDVWRHRHLKATTADAEALLYRALRLAPRLGSMQVRLPSSSASCRLLFTAPCAARTLWVNIYRGEGAKDAALLIRHQRGLGRLRNVDVLFEKDHRILSAERKPSKAHATLLFRTLASTSGLDSIAVGGLTENYVLSVSTPTPYRLRSTVPASLTRLFFYVNEALEDVFNFLLAAHAATLKEVDFRANSFLFWVPSPSAGQLLATMPNLTSLACPALHWMDALTVCKSLRRIHFFFGNDCWLNFSAARDSAAAAFFRDAHQLQAVHLAHIEGDIAVTLVAALAASGRSCVEWLCIDNGEERLSPQLMQDLLGALPSLPALRRLRVDLTRDPDNARTLLSANPTLHVETGSECLSKFKPV